MTMVKEMEETYTSLQIALLDLFSDGMKHPIMEVLELIRETRNDYEVSKPNMAESIRQLRKKLPKGREIHCVSEGRRKYYLMVRHLNPT